MIRHTNKLLLFLLVFSLMIPAALTGEPVSADDGDDSAIGDVTDPGILPGSGFYFLKSWGRNLQLMFAANSADKARLQLKYANEDALALKKLCDSGKCDVAARHTLQYTIQMQNTVQAMEQLRAQQDDEATEELNTRLQQNYMQQQAMLASVLENAPQSAQNGILNAIENSNRHIEGYILQYQGQAALEQYQEQVLQQTANMGQATKLKVQQRLQASHGNAGQQSGSTQLQNQTQTQGQIQSQSQSQSQTQTQTQVQVQQQTGQQSSGSQGNQGSNSGGKK